MKKFLKKHKKGFLIGMIIVIVLLLLVLIKILIFPTAGHDKYGDRLKGIEKHKITNKITNKVEEAIKNKEGVTKVTYNLEGKIINYIITVDGIDKDDAKSIDNIIKDNLSDDIKDYYDIQIFIKSKNDSEEYPIIGYKHNTDKSFSWSNN